MIPRLLLALPLLALIACQADADGDGLTNGEEKDLGLDKENADTDGDGLADGDEVATGADPLNADTDGDGLSDGDEIANGADPLRVDTDDDGYTDRDEVFEGHDPADDKDRIYKGRWPYYFEKDEVSGGAMSGTVETGKRFGRFEGTDQFGDVVALFDFYNADKPVVIDISAQWCPPCQAVSAWLDGSGDPYYSALWPAGPEVVERGDVYWVTILGENNAGDPATGETVSEWYDQFPSKHIPVLADEEYWAVGYVGLQGWPTGFLLEPDLKVSRDTTDGYVETVLSVLNERYPE